MFALGYVITQSKIRVTLLELLISCMGNSVASVKQEKLIKKFILCIVCPRKHSHCVLKNKSFCVLFNLQRDGMARFQKEEEEKTLKAITLFCFPEGINWAPLTEYHRYNCSCQLFFYVLYLYFTVHLFILSFCFQ